MSLVQPPLLYTASRPYKFQYTSISIYKSYHAGPPLSTHIPLHGGVFLLNPRRMKRASVGGIVTKGGVPYVTLNEHFARSRQKEGEGQPLLGYDSSGNWSSTSPPQAVVVPYPLGRVGTEYMDAAIAEALVPVSFEIMGVGIPTGVTAPRKGMKVMFSGATSGIKRGTIKNTNVTTYRRLDVKDLSASATYGSSPPGSRLKNVVSCSIDSSPGDSGSWVFADDGSRRVVGIHFAGHKDGSMFVRADAIASAFGVSFVGRQGVVQPAKTPASAPPVTGVGSEFDGNLTRGDVALPSNPIEAIMALVTGKASTQMQLLAVGGGIVLVYLLTRGR